MTSSGARYLSSFIVECTLLNVARQKKKHYIALACSSFLARQIIITAYFFDLALAGAQAIDHFFSIALCPRLLTASVFFHTASFLSQYLFSMNSLVILFQVYFHVMSVAALVWHLLFWVAYVFNAVTFVFLFKHYYRIIFLSTTLYCQFCLTSV